MAYTFPIGMMTATILIYFAYARQLLGRSGMGLLAVLFFLAAPLLALNMLNFTTSRFVLVFLVALVLLATREFSWRNAGLMAVLIFCLTFSHTGTYLFLLTFAGSYFILSALIWRRFEWGMYTLIVLSLFIYVFTVRVFPFIQPQYIDKGWMLLSTAEWISNKLTLGSIQTMGQIFYDNLLVSDNIVYALFWSCILYSAGTVALALSEGFTTRLKRVFHAVPILGQFRDVPHGALLAPFWMGPLQVFLSIFGFFRIDWKGKCIALSLLFSALLPGALSGEGGTGALREIYYLVLIVPVCAAAGFYFIVIKLQGKARSSKFAGNAPARRRRRKIYPTLLAIFLVMVFIYLMAVPVIASIYYEQELYGSGNERENLIWLSGTGNSNEGVADVVYRDRISLYADKVVPSVPAGSETSRYSRDLAYTLFLPNGEGYADDLYTFNVKYVLVSDRILEQYGRRTRDLGVEYNWQMDRIFSSDSNFSVYRHVDSLVSEDTSGIGNGSLFFDESGRGIQELGPVFLFENDFYKIKLSSSKPLIVYYGTPTRNLFGEAALTDSITYSWTENATPRDATVDLSGLKYTVEKIGEREVLYRSYLRDPSSDEKLLTLLVTYKIYDRMVEREITLVNDWVIQRSDFGMDVWVINDVTGPYLRFSYDQKEDSKWERITKRIYPAQDMVRFKDIFFNNLYFSEGSTGIYVVYGNTSSYPTRLLYAGSTIYDYGTVVLASQVSPQVSQPARIINYLSIGNEKTARENVRSYSTVTRYPFPEGEIPVILTGLDTGNYPGESGSFLKDMEENNMPYSPIGSVSSGNLQGNGSIGIATVYDRRGYLNRAAQETKIQSLEEIPGVTGGFLTGFRFNPDTIYALASQGLHFILAPPSADPLSVPRREDLLSSLFAYYRGRETRVLLLPVLSTSSSSLTGGDTNPDTIFSRWQRALEAVSSNGGMVVFLWHTDDLGNPEFSEGFTNVSQVALEKGMTFTTPDAVASHMILLRNVSTDVKRGIDDASLDIRNHNSEPVMGLSYRVELPVLDGGCPYSGENGRIVRMKKEGESCILYAATDLEPLEEKVLRIAPSIAKKQFSITIMSLYEGNSRLRIRDGQGNPISNASVITGGRYFQSGPTGEVTLPLLRGSYTIRIEKAGYKTVEGQIQILGRIYEYLPFLKRERQVAL
jgi:hypothetical protein